MWKRTLLILIILPVIGCSLGYIFAERKYSSNNVNWESLGSPPSPAVSFIQGFHNNVVETTNGDKYRYYGQSKGWIYIEEEPPDIHKDSFADLCNQITPDPLDNIIATTEDCVKYETGYAYYKFAILDDGSVWMWNKPVGVYVLDSLFYIFKWALGFFIIGIIILTVMSIRNRIESKEMTDVDT
jgi:hypothetical protein